MDYSNRRTAANTPPSTMYTRPPAAGMSYEEFLRNNPRIGYLKVQASRARQSIPQSGVRIFIVQDFNGERVLFFEGETDANGIIDGIELPAPPRAESLDPQEPQRGAVYQVYASHPNFNPERYQAEIFENITGILPVTLRLAQEG